MEEDEKDMFTISIPQFGEIDPNYRTELKRYMEQITLNELSERFMFHPVYITRCVIKKYNLTPQQLLTKIRMEHAAQLLEETSLHVNLIGQSVGYSDAAYFSKLFKKYYGITAKEYRNMHTNSHLQNLPPAAFSEHIAIPNNK